MPDISKITLPSGTTYDIKDATARAQIEALVGGDAVIFIGVSSTSLTDGGNEKPTIDGEQKNPEAGQLFFYQTQEFIYGPDNKWHQLGSLDTLGALAHKNSATGNYQPAGTVSQPTFSGDVLSSTGKFTPQGSVEVVTKSTSNKTAAVTTESGNITYTPAGEISAPTINVSTAGATTTIKNPSSVTVAKEVVAAAPGAEAPANNITYYSVNNQTLSLYQLGYTTGSSISTTNVDVKTGDATYSASQPVFTGTGVRLVTGDIPVPSAYTATFSGAENDVNVTGTPSGSVTQPTFQGTPATITVE